ncbi:MAG: Eco57I restriction-modification methylase domain-containing protein [Lentisphaeria bacterium]|nr:Eco57I restriction-modification methylase domain-containing protein [Lentisphaeria bacterium]
MAHRKLFDIPFLSSVWGEEYVEFTDSPKAREVYDILKNWSGKKLNETQAEGAFVKHFFHQIWGYDQENDKSDGSFNCFPQFPVAYAGQTGGMGKADLALGLFNKADASPAIPQVLCEFKDIRSALDKNQNRKGNTRSPVQQCFNYLRRSRTQLSGHELVKPYWAIVTDMNEFRLYGAKHDLSQYQRFVIDNSSSDAEDECLLGDTESAAFLRFLFFKLFHKDSLLSERGPSLLQNMLDKQFVHEEAVERDFYLEYKAYREYLFDTIRKHNPGYTGTPGKLVRLTQRLLDRCLFILFCEDMGLPLFPGSLLRTALINYSKDPYFSPSDNLPWERLKNIFAAMRDGGTVGEHAINPFNGGLFEPLPELENLVIPAEVFCAKNQGANGMTSLLAHPLTLLYFSAKYNFGIKNAKREKVIDFYALGRIFEQSITELEIMEAEADGRPSINLLSKRKRDGVYYTPEWVTEYIVRETVGTRLEYIKQTLGLSPDRMPNDDDVVQYKLFLSDKRRVAPVAGAYIQALEKYLFALKNIKVVDPACGSGAFLIQALEYLKKEYRWIYDELERVRGFAELWETDEVTKFILANNIYGVDINPESVEICKLALWMHTAVAGRKLSHLDGNIKCGNSLVGSDFKTFYAEKHASLFDELDETKRERINAFDWRAAFPDIFSRGGFDCVIGNPPYVKLQNFRKVEDDVADYLVNAKLVDGSPVYKSTQSGNFDLYLPFIEKGISLLRSQGRMGYIAPNVWMVNEYGKPLRHLIRQTRTLDRWVDFKSFQVFTEATTYTALQFFTGSPNDFIKCAFAPDGVIDNLDWNQPDAVIPHDELPMDGAWNLIGDSERRLLHRLRQTCRTLEDASRAIVVGIQTSADYIYHLNRVAPGRYRTKANEEVSIEDGLMHPLVSGPEAKRYHHPQTDTYLLFPYDLSGALPRLFAAVEMAACFPNGWQYLRRHEAVLRAREGGKMNDDDRWWAYNYPKNLDKQEIPKLFVAQTVPGMRVCYDCEGAFYFNNVRVNGIIPTDGGDGWYLLGVLNAPVADNVFRQTAKPKDGGWFEANRQFIAPLPIPDATPEQRAEVGARAKELQELHTLRRDTIAKLDQRLHSRQTSPVAPAPKYDWLWSVIGTPASWKTSPLAPAGLSARNLTAWAKQQHAAALQERLDTLDALLKPGTKLAVTNTDDELILNIGGYEVIHLFDKPDTPFIAAQWRHALRDVNVTEAFDGKRLIKRLLTLRTTTEQPLRDRILALDAEITGLDHTITEQEASLDTIIYGLYKLEPAEIAMIEAD